MTNLFTSQQVSNKVVEVEFDHEHDEFTTQFGPVRGHPRTQAHSRSGPGRSCLHALETPWDCSLFSAAWVARLGWQPVLYENGRGTPTIASRWQDIVTIAFDVIGSPLYCTHVPTALEERNKFHYKLFRVHFAGEDDTDERSLFGLLGVW